jgi:branched-chain amino acid transport system ATP-binding protein
MTGSAATPPLLALEELELRFGTLNAFTGVTARIDDGELFAVIGPNGAGKTSLFNVLSRIYRPTHGRMRFRGRDLGELRVSQLAGAGIARTLQNLGLFPTLTVLDNVLIGRHHLMRSGPLRGGLWWGFARGEEQRHREALDFAGVARFAPARVGTLPYGVRKRVELARALAMEPVLLLLDEPVAGMSAAERQEVTALVRRMHRERGLAMVLVEHDMGMVMQVAERIMVLDFGRVIATGTPAEVQQNEAVIRAYLGEPLEAAP